LVHAYDYFKVVDAYVGAAIAAHFRPIKTGESYLDIFSAQTSAYADMIRAYPGDFLGHVWPATPIEILFIDIAKTPELCAHAVGQFFPNLIPGQSVLVHQDYFHCWHPYIHIGMEYLDEEFELMHELVPHQSRVWRLVKPIPAEKIARLTADGLDRAMRMALLERLIRKSSPTCRPMIEVARLWQMCLDGDAEGAMTEFDRLDDVYDYAGRRELWAQQALEIKASLTVKVEA
jgi:hypothetical protein